MAGATGLEPATSGVTGRPFSNEINGTLDKIRTITCEKSAKSLRSNQTNTSHQCLARERRKSHSPRPEIATPVARSGQGWFAFQSGPFRPLSGRGRCWSPRTCACGRQLLLLQRRHLAAASAQCGPTILNLRHSMTELDFCALDAAEHLENWLSWQGAIRSFSSQVLGKLAQTPDRRHRILEQGGYLRHLFKASAETLLTIAVDPKHLGARICVTSVLHTWGSRAQPITWAHDRPGGRPSLDGNRWISSRPNYFLPVEALSHCSGDWSGTAPRRSQGPRAPASPIISTAAASGPSLRAVSPFDREPESGSRRRVRALHRDRCEADARGAAFNAPFAHLRGSRWPDHFGCLARSDGGNE
jgi:hypothetical protein